MSELKTRAILFEALTLGEDNGEGGEEPQRQEQRVVVQRHGDCLQGGGTRTYKYVTRHTPAFVTPSVATNNRFEANRIIE